MHRNNVTRIICVVVLMVSSLAYLIVPSGEAVAQAGSNLVLNPGFENQGSGGAGDAADWTEGANHARSSDKFHTGGWSLRSTFRGAGTDTRTAAPIAVQPNTTYTYSGYVWRTNATGGACMDMADLVGERQLCTKATGSWQLLSGTWSSGANTSVTLRLITDGSPTGDIWFDDISLIGPETPTATSAVTNTPVPPTNTATATLPPVVTNTPPAGGNLVLNPGFEAQGTSAADAANWTEGANHVRASDKFHAGSWSLRSTFRGAGTDTRTAAPIAVQPNTTYTYSGYVWRTNGTGGACLDMADLVGERQLCTRTAGSWQYLSGTWSSGANTSVTLRLITDGSPTGDIWFDDIALEGPGGPVVTPTNTSVVPTNTPTQTSTPTSTPISPTVTPGSGGNLVLNGGFETQGTDAADAANWTEGTNHVRASDKFHAGSWSLHSTFRGAGTDTQTTLPILVSPNTNYVYSGYVWRTTAVGGACLDMADLVGEAQLCTNTAGSWQLLSGTWNSGSNASVTLRLITDGSPTGDIWFDDISLEVQGPPPTPRPTNTPDPRGDPVIAAAGDIGCDPNVPAFNGGYGDADECHQMQVSDLLVNAYPALAAVLTLGDNSNADGALYVYQQSYDPTWGRVKGITHPAVGNHDYLNAPDGDGYFTYFGAAAGERGKGYYSYDVGTWHLIALNSNCSRAGGCGVGSPQEQWLRADLAAHPNMCTLAYWHHPRFSSGQQGSSVSVDPLWKALYESGVELVLNGHDHIYERYAPQNPSGVADPKGIQEFIVGTGGKVMNNFGTTKPNSLVRHTNTFGVLKLTLHPDSYDWEFVPEAGQTWTDTGTRNCFTP